MLVPSSWLCCLLESAIQVDRLTPVLLLALEPQGTTSAPWSTRQPNIQFTAAAHGDFLNIPVSLRTVCSLPSFLDGMSKYRNIAEFQVPETKFHLIFIASKHNLSSMRTCSRTACQVMVASAKRARDLVVDVKKYIERTQLSWRKRIPRLGEVNLSTLLNFD